MKQLLKKEFLLSASPLSYLFIAFSAMTLIPGYPILVGAFFVCLGVFYTFQLTREQHDILFTALLPVKKSDVVKAKYCFVVCLEVASLLLFTLFTIIRMTLLNDAAPYLSNPLMSANLAFLGYVFLVFTLFNTVFLGGFFKTAYFYGKPFVTFCVSAFLLIAFGETLHHLPGLEGLNAMQGSALLRQLPVLAIGLVAYPAGTFCSMKRSIKRFEQIDL